MKMFYTYLTVITLVIGSASLSFAAPTDLKNTSATDQTVTIAARGNNPAFNFEPSTNVQVQGLVADDGSEYALQTYHSSVLARNSGKAFGVTSETNITYWLDISASTLTEVTALDKTDETAFATNWKTM
jgi:hypothetical protein